MPTKEQLLKKLQDPQMSKNFTVEDLNSLMSKCNLKKSPGGRGSAIRYFDPLSGRILIFDAPHPQKELYRYQLKLVRKFLESIGELGGNNEK